MNNMEKTKVIRIHNEYPDHDWMKNSDGKINEFAMSYGFHNGPMCKRCYESFCIYCESYEDHSGPCITDEYRCPKCEHKLEYNTNYHFCYNCGQALDWSE